jgi:alkylhydroperoxidase family enzyme
VDAHLTFLQAAGMAPHAAHALETDPLTATLDPDLRALVDLAVLVTRHPHQVGPGVVVAAARASHSRAEYLDAVGVMVAFNFVNRVANALQVDLEINPRLHNITFLRAWAIRLIGLMIRMFVDLRPRRPRILSPDANLRHLDDLFRCTNLGPLPSFFRQLNEAAHLLEVQRVLLEEGMKLCRENFRIFVCTGAVVLDRVLNPEQDYDLRKCVTYWLQHAQAPAPERILKIAQGAAPRGFTHQEAVIFRFAHDVTCCSDRITQARVDELRTGGFGDAEILDLVIYIAIWNALARLELLLTGLEEYSESSRVSRVATKRVYCF